MSGKFCTCANPKLASQVPFIGGCTEARVTALSIFWPRIRTRLLEAYKIESILGEAKGKALAVALFSKSGAVVSRQVQTPGC